MSTLPTRGTIVLDNEPGRALRRQPITLRAADVVYCGGAFRAGDLVYVTFRARDGGQQLLARGIVRCDELELRHRTRACASAVAGAGPDTDNDLVMRREDVTLLWPSR